MSRPVQNDPTIVLNYIIQYKENHDGLSPSIQNICDGCGMASPASVVYVIAKLERQGFIKRLGKYQPGIMVTGGQWSLQEVIE